MGQLSGNQATSLVEEPRRDLEEKNFSVHMPQSLCHALPMPPVPVDKGNVEISGSLDVSVAKLKCAIAKGKEIRTLKSDYLGLSFREGFCFFAFVGQASHSTGVRGAPLDEFLLRWENLTDSFCVDILLTSRRLRPALKACCHPHPMC